VLWTSNLYSMFKLSVVWQNTWENQLIRRKGWFCLTVSEVSVHGWLASSFPGLWWGRTSWWLVCDTAKLLTSWRLGSKERERKTRFWITCLNGTPQWPNLLPLHPTLNRFYHFPIVPSDGDQAPSEPLGNILDPNYNNIPLFALEIWWHSSMGLDSYQVHTTMGCMSPANQCILWDFILHNLQDEKRYTFMFVFKYGIVLEPRI
jgi:hypothetical protein